MAASPKIKLDAGAVGDSTLRRNRAAADSALKFRDVEPVFGQRQHAVAVLQADRQIAAGKVRIHDFYLAA